MVFHFCIVFVYILYTYPHTNLLFICITESETPALDSEVETREDEKTEKLKNDVREMKG